MTQQLLVDVAQELDGERAEAALFRGARELPDDDAVRAAAQRVMRPEARELICDALFSLAATDTVSESEWKVLDWLTDTWKMPRMRG